MLLELSSVGYMNINIDYNGLIFIVHQGPTTVDG